MTPLLFENGLNNTRDVTKEVNKMNIPMREKYVDEAVGMWLVFGEHADGRVDVNDGIDDVFCRLPRDVAEKICEIHANFRHELYKVLCNFPTPTKGENDGTPEEAT